MSLLSLTLFFGIAHTHTHTHTHTRAHTRRHFNTQHIHTILTWAESPYLQAVLKWAHTLTELTRVVFRSTRVLSSTQNGCLGTRNEGCSNAVRIANTKIITRA